MNEKDKALEFKVGLFVFTGLLVIAAMVVKFGQIGQGFHSYYDLTVEFSNASGLIKRADVQLAGARIGYIDNKPEVVDATHVPIHLKIIEGTVIPRKSKFQVGSSGLLGDKFVEVIPTEDFDPKTFDPKDRSQTLQKGETIIGTNEGGLQALQKKGEIVLDQLNSEIIELKKVTVKINEGLLSDANQQNLAGTLSNLHSTSEHFVEASKNINGVVVSAQGAVDSAKKSMANVDNAVGDFRKTVADGHKVLDSANEAIRTATHGNGLIASLLTDPKLSENLRALSFNLRKHGILFYKDSAEFNGPAPLKIQSLQSAPSKTH